MLDAGPLLPPETSFPPKSGASIVVNNDGGSAWGWPCSASPPVVESPAACAELELDSTEFLLRLEILRPPSLGAERTSSASLPQVFSARRSAEGRMNVTCSGSCPSSLLSEPDDGKTPVKLGLW